MLTYKKYGNGKVGYITTEYQFSDDNKIKIRIIVGKEIESETIETIEVPLTHEERKMLQKFKKGLEERPKPFLEEQPEKLEDSEINYNGIIIKEDAFKEQIQLLIQLIESNHEEISRDKIAFLYDKTCQRLYHKKIS